ncbi:MAG: geranylgeranylglyceryl/heptaprenylglyceryl phosphate synthase [Paenibacillaceae bacterium ZCTH02-B3]|nr:MAG: geranylgeranylglyceryl/heptaprenylglyceryl phosphate synthase [Paenibacillaceae bacterium ZCTH02-B3]
MAMFFRTWRHVFKLDPDRAIDDRTLERVCRSGTDAVLLGGSSGVTYGKTVELLTRVRRYEVPCALEVTDPSLAVPGFDGYFVPMVLNARHRDWWIGRHAEALRRFGRLVPWDITAGEAYIVLNGDSAVARVTDADTGLDADGVAAYCQLADRLWRVPVVYLEYSGVFGDMELVRRVRGMLKQARLFYGGGVRSPQQAREAARAAHTVVVGNAVYDDPDAALATVEAVKGAEPPV